MQIGTAQVGIYEQDPLAHLSQRDSQIDRSGTLALDNLEALEEELGVPIRYVAKVWIENGRPIKNREVAERIGKKMGLDKFPVSDPGKITAYFRDVTGLLTHINPGDEVNPLLSIRTMTRNLFANLFPKK